MKKGAIGSGNYSLVSRVFTAVRADRIVQVTFCGAGCSHKQHIEEQQEAR